MLLLLDLLPHETRYDKMKVLNVIARVLLMWVGQCEHNRRWHHPSGRSRCGCSWLQCGPRDENKHMWTRTELGKKKKKCFSSGVVLVQTLWDESTPPDFMLLSGQSQDHWVSGVEFNWEASQRIRHKQSNTEARSHLLLCSSGQETEHAGCCFQ